MEEARVTAATGALGPVVAKLSALVRRRGEYQLRRRTRKDVKLIGSKLKSVHSILWVIWERQDLDAAGKELRMEAWRLADDMNDAIDDFILTMSRSNDGKRSMQAKNQPSPFQDLKRRAVDVSQQCRDKWKLETSHTIFSSLFSTTKSTVESGGPAGKWPRPRVVDPYVHKDISELVGMEQQRDTLIKHLVGEEENTPQLKMASILGAAGMGKTTLARLVYEAIEDKFDARAFVSITSCHNMTEVLTSILRQVAADDDSTAVLLGGTKAVTEEYLIGIISNFLKDKRYLVIIDDIWHCGEWETIKKSLPDNNLGSRIVTTSRVNAITDEWHDDFDALVHKIDHGHYQRKAFTEMIANMVGEDFDPGHHIVKMCHHGMPLAVACMISALAKERERQEQQGLCVRTRDVLDRIEEQVMRNGIQNTPGFELLVESLELGYNHLPHHMLKTCLLYCSIYPEGHYFYRGNLVRRWIAEGFVCTEEAAKDYFDELVSRRLIIGSLHPMMRNYLRRKLREYNFITCTSDGVPSSPVGRLCIDYWPSSDAVQPLSGIGWHHIRSLVVLEGAERVPYERLQHLRVLDVQPNSGALKNQHVKDICGLLRLRHLFVSGPGGLRPQGVTVSFLSDEEGITEIPTEMARLQYLETLNVTRTNIRRLPAEIGDLEQLKTLDVSWNRKLAELPREMGNLQHILETLRIHRTNLREQAWEIIRTLKKLKNLDVSRNPELSGIPRDIGELLQLKNLNAGWNQSITELPKEICKLQRLQTLNLRHTGIRDLPREIGNLQHLEALDYSSFGEVRKIPREIVRLKKLKNLNVHLSRLPFEAVQLLKQERLPKCVLQALKNSDLMSSLEGEILSYEKTSWHGGGGLVVGRKHMHIPQCIKEHFNNIGTLDVRICKLEEQDLKILREMPNLWNLKLRFEAVPKKSVDINSGGFAKLRDLSVDSRVPRVTFQEEAMPSLTNLWFEFQFYGGPPNTDHPIGIQHLVSLELVRFNCNGWYGADSPCIGATIDVVRKEAREHENKITLQVSGQADEIFPEKNIFTQSSEHRNVACSRSAAQEIKEIQA